MHYGLIHYISFKIVAQDERDREAKLISQSYL